MNNTPVQPVILAGGSGTRLWPLSRQHYAKQYLALGGDKTLLQETAERLDKLPHVPPLIVCNEETRFLAAEQMRQIGQEGAKILLEPAGRNTAPAIALAALEAVSDGEDPVLLVMPADHKVTNTKVFIDAVKSGVNLSEAGHLVTFGIVPDKPEIGYGYIRRGTSITDSEAFVVDSFVEKPERSTAESYLSSGGYYWNSGIFMFRASKYLEELEKFRPDILEACQNAFAAKEEDLHFLRFNEAVFLTCPDESVDYAVMEKTNSAVVLPIDVGWSDIGSWSSLWEASPKNASQNCEVGDVLNLDGSGNYINAGSRLVATIGLEDMVVVETKDVVLVAPKNRVQDVKDIVKHLKDEGRSEYQHHREVYRPWGKYDCVDIGDRYQVKRITVKPGAKLSVQKHHHRAEHWVVVSGTANVTKGEETILLTENQSTYIPLGEVHSLENPGKVPLELIEVQSGSYLGEDDIVRFEDRYGRD
ncbi:mannose-1-phosphate guanylyltransferase/mannose-6-phosphate isomerase [Rhodobacterales bacterium 52_120_T64]|nr:mannose-1-phosphate guanylyltransferase/mannose-6-phosphate isomerase [Rhodobacterales bacterium 52_120_T64]